ncbi:MAG: MFS transporter [Candidatus Thorarchaeota archaeon]|nr:MFS transporter [Candidatus Thorarchaeota archaeon]
MNNRIPLSRTTKIVIAIAFVLFSAYNLVLSALQNYVLLVSGDTSTLGISFGVFTLAAVLSRFLSGWIIDRIDDAIALILANMILTVSLGFYPMAMGITTIYVIRAVQGFGWALSTVTILTMIAENTESTRVSEALGYLNGFGSFSLLIFPVFGSWLVAINTLESFQLCFLIAFGISGISTGLSIYAWRTIPPAVTHEAPVAGFPDRGVLSPTLSAFLLFIPLGVFLSYSPEIAVLNSIQNPGTFFSVYALAQILGSVLGGIWTGTSRYGRIATIGALLIVFGVILMFVFAGIIGYLSSAFTIGFGIAAANIALNSHVSSVSISSEAKGMAVYSAGVDTAIAVGSFGTAMLLSFGWGIPTILLVLGCAALISALHSYVAIR